MYMRLLGYPAEKISIICMYSGQRSLIKDVLQQRCAQNVLFGLPATVSTVDRYQGEQNDCNASFIDLRSYGIDIILSLVRTKQLGYLRDIRRLTVAFSRARLGLYILGYKPLFEQSTELKVFMDMLLSRDTTLQLVTGEMWPASRLVRFLFICK
jgi:intron-binding protein aquarius